MNGCYSADPAVQAAILETLELHRLPLCPTAATATRRPGPAATFERQMERIMLSARVFADVRRLVRIAEADRMLIDRLVHAACQRLEDEEDAAPAGRQDTPPPARKSNPIRRPDDPRRSSSPGKTNPTRTVRSSQWTGKGVRS